MVNKGTSPGTRYYPREVYSYIQATGRLSSDLPPLLQREEAGVVTGWGGRELVL